MKRQVILLVEDNPDDEELMLTMLREHRVKNEVVVARDGREAVRYLFGTGADPESDANSTPAVVLLDLKLPKLDGLEVLRRLRADPRTQSVPVVIFTSSREQENMLQGYNLGPNSYVRKPVGFAAFAEAVRQLQLHWLILSEPPSS